MRTVLYFFQLKSFDEHYTSITSTRKVNKLDAMMIIFFTSMSLCWQVYRTRLNKTGKVLLYFLYLSLTYIYMQRKTLDAAQDLQGVSTVTSIIILKATPLFCSPVIWN